MKEEELEDSGGSCSRASNVNIEIVRADSARDFNLDSEYRL